MKMYVAALIVFTSSASAGDVGQIPPDVPDHIRQWFRSVRSPNGVPCCDIADGHVTTWRSDKDGNYEVPIEGRWVVVPPKAILHGVPNPMHEPIVWYGRNYPGLGTPYDPEIYIRCFVPGDGA